MPRIRSTFRRPAVAVAAAFVVALTIVGALIGTADRLQAGAIAPAQGCGDLLDYFRSQVGDWYGHDDDEEIRIDEGDFIEAAQESAIADDGAEPSASGGGDESAPADEGSRSKTGTNIQVAGVDESDIVKTDGEFIYVLRPRALKVARIIDGGVEFEGQLDFDRSGIQQEILIAGDRLIAFRNLEPAWNSHLPVWSTPERTQIIEINIADPTKPRLLRTFDSYGQFVSARLVGGSLRTVLRSSPDWGRIEFHANQARWRDGWEQSVGLTSWLPIYALTDHQRDDWRIGYTVGCDDIHLPNASFGMGATLLLTFEIGEDAPGLAEWGSAGVVGDSPTIYASTGSLYLAQNDWRRNATHIHRFDLAEPLEPRYAGSAQVDGSLINQFAISEYRGHLRVASTRGQRQLVNDMTIFALEDDALPQTGQLTGLGPTESIFAVRYLGERGYVVTFRQVDPLFVLDLSDPANPTVAGELKIPGFSRYLHPLSGGLLLGVGQDADPNTGRPLGLQASLFDVSDPADPQQLARVELGDAESAAEFDHRAFTYHDGVAYLPARPSFSNSSFSNRWWVDPDDKTDAVLYALRVTADDLNLESTLDVDSGALRTLPIGDQLHVLTEEDLCTFALPTHEFLSTASY